MRSVQVLILVVAAVLSAGAARAQITAPVTTASGAVTGVRQNDVEVFKGIPYAAPPVGKLRWHPPQPVEAWRGVRRAEQFGPSCMQPATARFPRAAMSEDCLTLNIFRPTERPVKPLPVMVWIHGGGLVTGGSSEPDVDGRAFVRNGVMLVSINYRLGRLGIFAHPALSAVPEERPLANYALMDQIAALRWVKRNIGAFGGDPDNVTIFGVSAGGLSVDGLMIAPDARGLFHRAISQSGYGRGPFPRLSTATADGKPSAEAAGIAFANSLGVENASRESLRTIPAERIVDAPVVTSDMNFVLDGTIITEDLWAAFRAGRQAPVPFMLGSTSLEFPGFADSERVNRSVMTPAEQATLAEAYGGEAALIEHLPSDILFTQQARALARFHTQSGHPAFVYLFSVIPAARAAQLRGAPHGSEVPFVFDTLHAGRPPVSGAPESRIAKVMNATWAAFAKSGAPIGDDLPPWPRYDGATIMEFSLTGAKAGPDPRNGRLDALSRIIDPRS